MSTQEDKLKAIADAIRAKEGTQAPIAANDFPARITAIKTGTDISDATATAADLLAGKTAYGASGKMTGTIQTAEQAAPEISVDAAGLITAKATQQAGYVLSGDKSATKQLEVQAAATITPGTAKKTAVAAGRYTTGAVEVEGSADLKAENIKKGVTVFGVSGAFEGNSVETCEVSIKFTGLLGSVNIAYTEDTGTGTASKTIEGTDRNQTIYPVKGSIVLIVGAERSTTFNLSTGGGVDDGIYIWTYQRTYGFAAVGGDGTITIDLD